MEQNNRRKWATKTVANKWGEDMLGKERNALK
jgi:hypothetical protein